jgi:excisionase family DNA binding protein
MSVQPASARELQQHSEPQSAVIDALRPFCVDARNAAKFLGISRQQVDKMKRDGRLPAYYVKGCVSVRFKVSDLEAVIEAYNREHPRGVRVAKKNGDRRWL